MSHVSQDGEDDGGAEEGGEGVDAADGDGVAVTVVVELVVRAKSQQSSDPDAVRKEDLGAAVDPALAVLQALPVRSEQELEAFHRSGQGQSFNAQDAQDAIRKHGRKPNNLKEEKFGEMLKIDCSIFYNPCLVNLQNKKNQKSE